MPSFSSAIQLLTLLLLITVFPSHLKQISCFCCSMKCRWDQQEVIGHDSPSPHPAPPLHGPPPIKATIKGCLEPPPAGRSTNQESAASSAKISICKTVKLSRRRRRATAAGRAVRASTQLCRTELLTSQRARAAAPHLFPTWKNAKNVGLQEKNLTKMVRYSI